MRLSCLLSVAALAALSPLAVRAQTAVAPAPPPSASPMALSPNLTANGNLATTLKASPDFTILTKALDATNVTGVLATTSGLTLFAPTDAAFKALPPAELAALLDPKNVKILQKVVTYHLVHLDLPTSKFKGAKGPVQSVENSSLQLDGSGPVPKVNNADIIQADVRTSNGGLIQVVDKVLIPTDVSLPTASASAGVASPTGG
ncbi:MAG TPA: fasciclin domain-containing protein [Caulobacteraceae bacterium]